MIIPVASGTSLNFKVVGGTSEPANPKENTIWVNTDAEITGWGFSASAPTNPAEGMIWFQTGTSSPAAFNALKKNGIAVYPNGCKQYVSGAWVSKTAKTYQSGAWKDWGLYLIKNGDCTEVTGGWTAKHGITDGSSFKVDTNGLYWSQAYYKDGCWSTITHNSLIDFSVFKSFNFYLASLGGVNRETRKVKIKSTTGTYLAEMEFENAAGKWYSLDLSAVNIKGYVEFYVGAQMEALVSEAYLS